MLTYGDLKKTSNLFHVEQLKLEGQAFFLSLY